MIRNILAITAFLWSQFAFTQTENEITVKSNSIKTSSGEVEGSQSDFINVFVASEKELIVIQINNLNTQDLEIILIDVTEKELKKTFLNTASTVAFFETDTLYKGDYVIKISDGNSSITKKITLIK